MISELQYPRVFAWFTRLFAPRAPEPLRLSARVTTLENLLDDIDSRVDYLSAELKKVRGRQYAAQKRAQDDAGPTIDEQAADEAVHQPRTFPSTAHLARRLRGF